MKTIKLSALAILIALAGLYTAQAESILGFKINEEGDMGLGTDTPESKLHVTGDVLSEGVFKGNGYEGQYPGSALIQGFDLETGSSPQFLIGKNTNGDTSIIDVGAQTYKTFVIDHPMLEKSGQYLVHATLEGPEGAVFYRGTARLQDGKARIKLPDYFEALTRAEGRTVLLTNVDGFDSLAVRKTGGERIQGGEFEVYSDNPESSQEFDWEVKAVRKDKVMLAVEPAKEAVQIARFGPYTFTTPLMVSEAEQPED